MLRLPKRSETGIEPVIRLENEICRRFGIAAALCTPMARTALHLALLELIRPGQTVVMSPLTIVDVVNMVLLAGGIPVFADIVRESCGMDPDQAESLIDSRTGAILITHLHGATAGAGAFREICDRRGLPLIEDASQAFGAIEGDKRLGAIGDIGIYSFGFYKNLNTWRGGMLVSPDSGLISRIRRRLDEFPELSRLRLVGTAVKGLMTDAATWPPLFARFIFPAIRFSVMHGIQSVNRRLDPESSATRLSALPPDYLRRMAGTQAALALRQLDRVDSDTSARIARAAIYHQALSGEEGLVTPLWRKEASHIYTYYPIQCERRDALLRHAMQNGRDFAAQHLRNCADLPEFAELHRECPNARAASRALILLPTYPRYPIAEVRRNVEVIRRFVQSNRIG